MEEEIKNDVESKKINEGVLLLKIIACVVVLCLIYVLLYGNVKDEWALIISLITYVTMVRILKIDRDIKEYSIFTRIFGWIFVGIPILFCHYILRVRQDEQNEVDYSLNDMEIEDLNNAGIKGEDFFQIMESLVEGSVEVNNETSKKIFPKYEKIMCNPNIQQQTKDKLTYLLYDEIVDPTIKKNEE